MPGLGADERIFSKLNLNNTDQVHLKWLPVTKGETMESYARKMFSGVNTNEEFYLLGLSFGGMLCSEASRFLPAKGIIYVSTARKATHLPWWIRINAFFPLYRLLSDTQHLKIAKLAKHRLGIQPDLEVAFFSMLASVARPYFTGAIACIVNWRNETECERPYIHLHGDNDLLIPLKKEMKAIVIKKGSHAMIYDRAGEISEHIMAFLSQNR